MFQKTFCLRSEIIVEDNVDKKSKIIINIILNNIK